VNGGERYVALAARDVPGNLVLVECLPDGSQKPRKLFREFRMLASVIGERDELLADQVVERTLRAEATLDRLGRATLLNPDLLKPHARNTVLAIVQCNPSAADTPRPVQATSGWAVGIWTIAG